MCQEVFKIDTIIEKYCPKIFEHKRDSVLSDPVLVINLETDKIRAAYIEVIMKKMGISYTLVQVKPISPMIHNLICKKTQSYMTLGEVGCLISHLWCLQYAITNRWEHFYIFEDDVIFHRQFLQRLTCIFNSHSQIDFLMLGACDFDFVKYHEKTVVNNTYQQQPQSTLLYGGHAIYYSNAGAQHLLNHKKTHMAFFDFDWKDQFKRFPDSAFVCSPNLVCSDFSTTHLEHHYSILDDATDYNRLCLGAQFRYDDYFYVCLKLFEHSHVCTKYNSYGDFLVAAISAIYPKNTKVIDKLDCTLFTVEELNAICFKRILPKPQNLVGSQNSTGPQNLVEYQHLAEQQNLVENDDDGDEFDYIREDEPDPILIQNLKYRRN